jgi:hypothetical protein
LYLFVSQAPLFGILSIIVEWFLNRGREFVMRVYKALLALVIIPILTACSSVSQVQPLASPEQTRSALQFKSDPEYATIFVSSPYVFEGDFNYVDVFINGRQAGQLLNNQFITVKAVPGRHSFVVKSSDPTTTGEYAYVRNFTMANFELDLQAGAMAVLSCGNNSHYWQPSDRFLLAPEECSAQSGRRTMSYNGVTACAKDFKSDGEWKWYGKEYSQSTRYNCRLVTERQRYLLQTSDPVGVVAHTSFIDKALAPGVAKSPAVAAKPVVTKAVQPSITASQFAQLQKKAPCKLKNPRWAYTGKNCKNGLAHGKGSAVDSQGLKFAGTFATGQRVKGEINQDDKMIFSGNLVNDKPDGNAICLHEGEYEECRFFKGKRIDTLYKIRKENAKMQAEMAKTRVVRPATYSSARAKGIADYTVDALEREAADRAADFIFDSLF